MASAASKLEKVDCKQFFNEELCFPFSQEDLEPGILTVPLSSSRPHFLLPASAASSKLEKVDCLPIADKQLFNEELCFRNSAI